MDAIASRCAACVVRDAALCSALDNRELRLLSDLAHNRTLARGESLVWAGQPALLCANIIAGAMKLTAGTGDGREQAVGLLLAGDFLGEPFAAEARLTATALGPVELCVFTRAGFEQVLDARPKLERALLRRTLASLENARGQLLALARTSAAERIAALLLDLSRRVPVRRSIDGALGFTSPLTRGEMAELLGLSIETVSRQLSHLRAEGIIELTGSRGITLRAPGRLAPSLA